MAFVVCVLAIFVALLAAQTDDGKWFLGAGEYKKQVLAQPASQRGDLRHIEWGGWGMAGQETTVFLVYDPADRLASATNGRPGKFAGIPCEVPSVRALERSWYLVTFSTNADWDDCSP